MALGKDNLEIRRYLLGQLTDAEQQNVEERLLTDDGLYQELELAKDELTQEFVSGQLTATERAWLQYNFLVSPEGKERHESARTFARYARDHQAPKPIQSGLIERIRRIWNAQPKSLHAATAVAVLVIGVVIVLLVRTPAPRTVATLTLTSSLSARSSDAGPVRRVRLREDVLKLTLILPQPAPDTTFRLELVDDKGATKGLEARAQDSQSIQAEIDAGQLPRGQYAVTVSTIDGQGGVQRIPGNYYFIVE